MKGILQPATGEPQNDTADGWTVVVTGGEGFVGKYVRAELEQSWPGARIVSWDLPDVDITKPETYQEQVADLQPDWVVHLAALASVPLAFKQPEVVREVNVEGTRRLLKAVREKAPGARVLAVSSGEVYGKAFNDYDGQPVPELPLAALAPMNLYAASKVAMEQVIVAEYLEMCVRVRPFPHFGPGQKEGFVTADFAAQVARIESGIQPEVMKVGNLESQRDFTDVREVAAAYRLLMEAGKVGGVYNVASGRAVKIQDILDELLRLAKVKIMVEQDPERLRTSEVPVAVGNAKKLLSETGWKSERAWQKTLAEVLEWWRNNI